MQDGPIRDVGRKYLEPRKELMPTLVLRKCANVATPTP